MPRRQRGGNSSGKILQLELRQLGTENVDAGGLGIQIELPGGFTRQPGEGKPDPGPRRGPGTPRLRPLQAGRLQSPVQRESGVGGGGKIETPASGNRSRKRGKGGLFRRRTKPELVKSERIIDLSPRSDPGTGETRISPQAADQPQRRVPLPVHHPVGVT